MTRKGARLLADDALARSINRKNVLVQETLTDAFLALACQVRSEALEEAAVRLLAMCPDEYRAAVYELRQMATETVEEAPMGRSG